MISCITRNSIPQTQAQQKIEDLQNFHFQLTKEIAVLMRNSHYHKQDATEEVIEIVEEERAQLLRKLEETEKSIQEEKEVTRVNKRQQERQQLDFQQLALALRFLVAPSSPPPPPTPSPPSTPNPLSLSLSVTLYYHHRQRCSLVRYDLRLSSW